MSKPRIITKNDLTLIAEMALDIFKEKAVGELNNSQFIAKCYLEASAHVLKLGKREYEERNPYEPADE